MEIDSVPIELYKYRDLRKGGLKYFRDMILNDRVRFSYPRSFNDPSECKIIYDVGATRDEAIHRFIKHRGSKVQPEVALQEAEALIPEPDDEFEKWKLERTHVLATSVQNSSIFCLSAQKNNGHMWTHYADAYRGICVKFALDSENYNADEDLLTTAYPVEYVDERPILDFFRTNEPSELIRFQFLRKAKWYENEEEYRVIRPNRPEGLYPLPKGIIKQVILGVRIHPCLRERVIEICRAYDGPIEVVRTELDRDTYGLKFYTESTV